MRSIIRLMQAMDIGDRILLMLPDPAMWPSSFTKGKQNIRKRASSPHTRNERKNIK